MASDTIYALATGRARSAIAVVRISGPATPDAISRLTGDRTPPVRQLARRNLVWADGEIIDDALVVTFAKGSSYTGEASAELHCHGGPAVLAAVLSRLAECSGLRLAEAGEFTRRAVVNGRLDLTEAEGVGDLIAAETEMQRRQAMRVMSGAVSDQADQWRETLLKARALVELTIDWADEEVPEDVTEDVRALLLDLTQQLETELARSAQAEKLRSGFEVALVGAPNVGKSSLLNAILGREAAITSEIPGTTRDVIEGRYDLDGVPVVFLDLAGLRETSDPVEKIGVKRALARARGADLRLFLSAHDAEDLDGADDLRCEQDVSVWTKSDMQSGTSDVSVSAKSGAGIAELLSIVADELPASIGEIGVLSHHRHCVAVEECRRLVQKCLDSLTTSDLEFLAEDLRCASTELERVVGRIGVEDVLGSVFSSFCLGK